MGTATAKAVPNIFTVNSLCKKADKFFAKIYIGNKFYYCQIDPGSPISLFPVKFLNENQRQKIVQNDTLIEAYGGSHINNLGCLKIDLNFESANNRTVELPNQEFYITSSSMMPILGCNILFAGNDVHSIDKRNEIALIGGKHVRIYDKVASTAKIVSGLKLAKRDKQTIFSRENVTIRPNSENVIPAYLKTLPSQNLFTIDTQNVHLKLQTLGGLYKKSQFLNFPVKLINMTEDTVVIKKNTKICPAYAQSDVLDTDAKTVTTISNGTLQERVDKIKGEMELYKGMSDIARGEVDRIIRRYHKRFTLKGELPGEAKLPPFDIHLKNEAPIAAQSYRTSFALRPILKDILDKNVKNGLMERSSSAWNSPTILVKKGDGSYRLVCDYRMVNEQIVADNYPLPKISDLLVQLHGSKYFIQTDLSQGFFQVPIGGKAKEVLTVGNEFGQYKFNRMPMGCKTSPSYFQRMMDTTFENVPLKDQVIFMDDLVNHGTGELKALKSWENSLKIMELKDLKVSAAKTRVLLPEIKFCGHIIRDGHLFICNSRVEAVGKMTAPTSKREAQSVFGFFNYLRHFIKNFAQIAKPISDTFRGYHFQWSRDAQTALDKLKNILRSNTLSLRIPDMVRDKFILETDASDSTMGGCLFLCRKDHVDDHGPDCLEPVQFFSENFSDSQFKKYIREKELLAFRNALAKFKVYLLGRRFVWRTDNNSLKWANSLKTNKDRIARLLAEVSEFDYEIQIKRSADLKVSDYLSRVKNVASIKIGQVEFAEMQANDKILSEIFNFVKIFRWPGEYKNSEEMNFWKKNRHFLFINENNCLVLRKGDKPKLIVPEVFRLKLIETYHDNSGHPGIENTLVTLGEVYTWYNMREDIRMHIKTCQECQRQKPNLRPIIPPPCKTDTSDAPFFKISCDLTGPLPVTNRDNKYIMVCNDHFSKKISARPLTSKHSWEVLRVFREVIHNNPYLPRIVLTDNGGEFKGSFAAFLAEKGIKHVTTAPYNPKANGLTERSNQTLKNRLQPHKNSTDWDLRLPEVTQLINMCPNDVTRLSPFLIETGYKGDHPSNPVQYKNEIQANLEILRQKIKGRQEREKLTRAGMPEFEDYTPYNINDKVLIKTYTGSDRYTGPFTIIQVFARGRSFKLIDENGKEYVRRSEELKPFWPRENEPTKHDQNSTKKDTDDDDFRLYFFEIITI